MQAKILGAKSAMKKFSFLFGIHPHKILLMRKDMIAKNLQGFKISAVEGAEYAKFV